MSMQRRPSLSHDVIIPEQEAYRGDSYWRPDDSSVEKACIALIERHSEEFQDLLDSEEIARKDRD